MPVAVNPAPPKPRPTRALPAGSPSFPIDRRKQPVIRLGPEQVLTLDDLATIGSIKDLKAALRGKGVDPKRITQTQKYERELERLQIELVKLQRWVAEKKLRMAVLFEGRDAAGKGGAIRRFTEYLSPRAMRVVALPKPTEEETGQWYFQRYIRQLPNRGEIVFFDRSWYNRAVVEPAFGFCSPEQYERFMRQVPEFENMLHEDGMILVKFWFSIRKEVQAKRFDARKTDPLKQWKVSPVDEKAQQMWDSYTHYKELMFSKTHTVNNPWVIVQANDKRKARLESIRHVLSQIDYAGRGQANVSLLPDPNVVARYQRSAIHSD